MQKKSYLCTMFWKCCICGCVAVCLFTGCSRRALHEAQAVVKAADSARAEGRMYGTEKADSIALAQAYHTLNNHPLSPYTLHRTPYTFPFSSFIFPLSSYYVRACYHYGRLLREKDDPVAAMQCFINATHARSRDYHILGRVYSNMGSICHLAGEFPLSYDMYSRSADMFFEAGDTVAYYYLHNDMAYELAEQGKKDSCLVLTKNIRSYFPKDSIIIAYCYMTQAQACLRCQQYDSVIYYAHQSKRYLFTLPASTLQLAQAYSLLGIKDSASYYADKVLKQTNSILDRNNALYILTNDDQTKDIDAVRQTGADRSDTQKLLEIRQGKLSQAVQLLEQDLNKKPDLRWIYTLVGILLFTIASVSFVIMWRKRKQHKRPIFFQSGAISANVGTSLFFSLAVFIVFWTNIDKAVTFLVVLAFSNQSSLSFFLSLYVFLSSSDIILQSLEALALTFFGSKSFSKPSLSFSFK